MPLTLVASSNEHRTGHCAYKHLPFSSWHLEDTYIDWRGNDDWNISRNIMKKQIHDLETDAADFTALFEKAFMILLDVIRKSQEYEIEVDRAFKSASLDRDIDKKLNA